MGAHRNRVTDERGRAIDEEAPDSIRTIVVTDAPPPTKLPRGVWVGLSMLGIFTIVLLSLLLSVVHDQRRSIDNGVRATQALQGQINANADLRKQLQDQLELSQKNESTLLANQQALINALAARDAQVRSLGGTPAPFPPVQPVIVPPTSPVPITPSPVAGRPAPFVSPTPAASPSPSPTCLMVIPLPVISSICTIVP